SLWALALEPQAGSLWLQKNHKLAACGYGRSSFAVRDTGRPGASGELSGRTVSAVGGLTAAAGAGVLAGPTGAGGSAGGGSFWEKAPATARTTPTPTRRPHLASVGIGCLSDVTSWGVRPPKLSRSPGGVWVRREGFEQKSNSVAPDPPRQCVSSPR